MYNFLSNNANFSVEEIEKYKKTLVDAMKKEGATQEDFDMLPDDLFHDIIITAMANKQNPNEVAWALLR